jgi:hypothetical protein
MGATAYRPATRDAALSFMREYGYGQFRMKAASPF